MWPTLQGALVRVKEEDLWNNDSCTFYSVPKYQAALTVIQPPHLGLP